MNKKDLLLKKLNELKESNQENIFHRKAYQQVINNIKLYKKEINCLEDISDIDGIGKKIKQQIKAILETEDIKIEENIFSKLIKIYGVGEKKANKLIKSYKIKSLEDLKNKVKENENILNENQKLGLKYYDDFLDRIPYSEMLIHQKILDIPKDKGEIVGSFRRQEASSGDIDVMLLISKEEFHMYVEYLKNINYLKHILAYGDKKMLGICSLGDNYKKRRIDIIRTDEESYAFMLLYFTGSAEFNIKMRRKALEKGYSLNEYGFTPKVKNIKTEEDIFKFLDLEYIFPKDRKLN